MPGQTHAFVWKIQFSFEKINLTKCYRDSCPLAISWSNTLTSPINLVVIRIIFLKVRRKYRFSASTAALGWLFFHLAIHTRGSQRHRRLIYVLCDFPLNKLLQTRALGLLNTLIISMLDKFLKQNPEVMPEPLWGPAKHNPWENSRFWNSCFPNPGAPRRSNYNEFLINDIDVTLIFFCLSTLQFTVTLHPLFLSQNYNYIWGDVHRLISILIPDKIYRLK